MANIKKISPKTNIPVFNQEIVDFLETLLERAKKGDIEAILVAASTTEDTIEFGKIGFNVIEALAVASRILYSSNIEWDGLSE